MANLASARLPTLCARLESARNIVLATAVVALTAQAARSTTTTYRQQVAVHHEVGIGQLSTLIAVSPDGEVAAATGREVQVLRRDAPHSTSSSDVQTKLDALGAGRWVTVASLSAPPSSLAWSAAGLFATLSPEQGLVVRVEPADRLQ